MAKAGDITVDRFADMLLIFVHGDVISQAELESIRYSDSIGEAVTRARRAGLNLHGDDVWDAAVEQAAQEATEQGKVNFFDIRTDPLNPGSMISGDIELPSNIDKAAEMTEEDYLADQAADKAAAEANSVISALSYTQEREKDRQEAALSEDGEEVALPNLLFPSLSPIAGDPRVDEHIRMVTSDDYSPWGPSMSRDRMYNFIDINMPGIEKDNDYWREQFATPGLYVSGDELLTYASLSPDTRARLEEKFVRAGLLEREDDVTGYVPGQMGPAQLMAMRTAMSWGTYLGTGYEIALNVLGHEHQKQLALAKARAGGGGAGRRPSFSVPASLREIPDYESISQESQNMFRQRLGRDAEDYETAVLADYMQERYREQNAEKIRAARAAFYAAQGGGQGVMEVEVPNPSLRLQKFLEERYEPEIERNEQVADTSATNRLMIDAITRGAGMVG
jgi:hypothetical protein